MSSGSSGPTVERVVSEATIKAAEIVLEARLSGLTGASRQPGASEQGAQAKGRAWVRAHGHRQALGRAGRRGGRLEQRGPSRQPPQLVPPSSPASLLPPPCLQFNLEVEDVPGSAKSLERWRRESGLPLVLEVRARELSTAAGRSRRRCAPSGRVGSAPVLTCTIAAGSLSTCRARMGLGCSTAHAGAAAPCCCRRLRQRRPLLCRPTPSP